MSEEKISSARFRRIKEKLQCVVIAFPKAPRTQLVGTAGCAVRAASSGASVALWHVARDSFLAPLTRTVDGIGQRDSTCSEPENGACLRRTR